MRIFKQDVNSDKVRLIFFGDTHVGNENFNEEKLKQMVSFACKSPIPYVLFGMGDFVDAITVNDKRFWSSSIATKKEMLQDLTRQQMKHFATIIKPAVDSSLATYFVIGNHEEKAIKRDNFNCYLYLLEDLLQDKAQACDKLAIVRLLLKSGTAIVRQDIFLTHGIGGGFREGAALNTIYDLSRFYVADIYAMGHQHKLKTSFTDMVAVDNRGEVKRIRKHYLVTGTFLEAIKKDTVNYFEGHRGEPTTAGWIVLDINIKNDDKKIETNVTLF